jgi:capsular exopolysaccharide synthesis family protein
MACCLGILVGALAAAATWFLLPPPKPMISTQLHIPPGSPFLFKTAEPTQDLQNHQRAQAVMVKSRLVLGGVLRDPKVAALPVLADKDDPLEWLTEQVKVDFTLAPEVMRISMQGHETDQLVDLVNAIRKTYLREVVERERSLRHLRLTRLGELRLKHDEQFQRIREGQREIEEKAGGRDARVRGHLNAFVQQYLGQAERELLQTRSDLRKAKIELEALKAKEAMFSELKVSEADVEEAVAKDAKVQALEAEVARRQGLLRETIARSAKKEASGAARGSRARLADARNDLEAQRRSLRPEIIRRLRERARSDLRTGIIILQGRIATLQKYDVELDDEVKTLRKRLVDLVKQGGRLEANLEDAGSLTEMLKKITDEEQKLKVELEAPSRVHVLEEAFVLRGNVKTRQALMAGLAGLGGLALVFLVVAWLQYRARLIDTVDEVAGGLGMRIVGTLPEASRRGRRVVVKGSAEEAVAHSVLTESVDAARSTLLFMAQQEHLKVFLVTSAFSREGKTSLVSHLAVSLARAGRKTLLIDGDLRNPTVHRLFQLPSDVGFSEILRGEVEPTGATQPTGLGELSVIPAGRFDTKAIRALAQGRAGEVLAALRGQYDFILIDSSPVLPVADALLIGQHADGALLSILRNVSRMPAVYATSQRIETMGIRMIGVIMNGVQGELYGSLYPYMTKAKTVVEATT